MYGDGFDDVATFATVLEDISNLAIKADQIGSIRIPIGSFDVGNLQTASSLSAATPSNFDGNPNLLGKLDANGNLVLIDSATAARGDVFPAAAADFVETADDVPSQDDGDPNDSGLRFPLFDNPGTAIQLLLGQPVDLFTYHMPEMVASMPSAARYSPCRSPLFAFTWTGASPPGRISTPAATHGHADLCPHA